MEVKLQIKDGKFVVTPIRKGYRKIPPAEFAELYQSGTKMRAIAKRFGVSLSSCKGVRKKLGLEPRPPHRIKRMTKAQIKKGDKVRIVNTDIPRLDGTEATVNQVASWGAFLTAPAAATGQFRAAWDEMELVSTHLTIPEYTGEVCDRCGSPNILRTGSCKTCQDCGENSGCS